MKSRSLVDHIKSARRGILLFGRSDRLEQASDFPMFNGGERV